MSIVVNESKRNANLCQIFIRTKALMPVIDLFVVWAKPVAGVANGPLPPP